MLKKKVTPKKLTPAMERLVGALQNQAIWGLRRENILNQVKELNGQVSETEAHLNALQGEITGTVNGMLDNNKNANVNKILEEAKVIVDKNMEDKRKQQMLQQSKKK